VWHSGECVARSRERGAEPGHLPRSSGRLGLMRPEVVPCYPEHSSYSPEMNFSLPSKAYFCDLVPCSVPALAGRKLCRGARGP
jgi:hypothetical protein